MPQLSLHSPLGAITVSEEDGAVVALDWGWGRDQQETPLLRQAREQLHAYFDGELEDFQLPLAPQGSPYRRRVWAALSAIPFGQTRTYGAIAATAGGTARSVGQANGCNPIPLIIPCHRVVASRHLGGYSGADGVVTKRWLLAHESRHVEPLLGLFDHAPTGDGLRGHLGCVVMCGPNRHAHEWPVLAGHLGRPAQVQGQQLLGQSADPD